MIYIFIAQSLHIWNICVNIFGILGLNIHAS